MEKIQITPSMAKEMLKHNTHNRPYSDATVRKYTQLMRDGKWGLSPDSIGFDVEGKLMNGQHRLSAVINSGTTQTFFVVHEMPLTSYQITDEGRKRRASDIVAIETNVKHYNVVASSVRLYMGLAAGRGVNTGNKDITPTNADILETYLKHEHIFNSSIDLANRCYNKLNFLGKKEVGGIFSYLVIEKQYEIAVVKEFFIELFFSTTNDPTITLLRDRLIKSKIGKATLKYSIKLSLIAKTWNAYIANRRLKCLKYSDEEGIVRFN